MQTQRLWLQVTAFLLLVWAGVAAVMWLTEDYVFTPEKTLALMSESPWYENERLGHEQRMQHLDKVITSVVKLDFSQRARMREDGEETIDRFMKSLTDEEKGEYIGRVFEVRIARVAGSSFELSKPLKVIATDSSGSLASHSQQPINYFGKIGSTTYRAIWRAELSYKLAELAGHIGGPTPIMIRATN